MEERAYSAQGMTNTSSDQSDHKQMAILKAYLDESGTHEGTPLTCSAGYVFTEEGSAAFQREWEPYLQSKGLKWFHERPNELQTVPVNAKSFTELLGYKIGAHTK
jgi:hypothetical protein